MAYANLIRAIVDWGTAQPDLLAGVLIGSRARSEMPADALSDLDLILFTSDIQRFTDDADWLETFGTVLLKDLGSLGFDAWEWIVVYTNGLKVDFALAPVAERTATLQALIDAFPHQGVLARGVKPLFDKLSPGSELHAPPAPVKPAPTPEALEHMLTLAWLDGLKAAKSLRRGDLWQAKMRVDGSLKAHLLTLLEWEAEGANTWYGGRFLETWGDADSLAALPSIFAAYTLEDVRRALLATLDLISVVGRKIAARLGSEYPADTERQMRAWIDTT